MEGPLFLVRILFIVFILPAQTSLRFPTEISHVFQSENEQIPGAEINIMFGTGQTLVAGWGGGPQRVRLQWPPGVCNLN